MKGYLGISTVFAVCVSMAVFGCAREKGSMSGAGTGSSLASSSSSSGGMAFDFGGISPGDSNATLEVTNGDLDPEADEKFSVKGGVSSAEAADALYVYWYVNWVLPPSDFSDPLAGISGLGKHTVDAVTLAHEVCTLGLEGDEFELWVVASQSEWKELDARSWTQQAFVMHWDWNVKWYPEQCADLPPRPEEDEGEEEALEGGSDDSDEAGAVAEEAAGGEDETEDADNNEAGAEGAAGGGAGESGSDGGTEGSEESAADGGAGESGSDGGTDGGAGESRDDGDAEGGDAEGGDAEGDDTP